MISVQEIMSMQMKATMKAAAQRKVPFVAWPGDAERIALGTITRQIPFLGKYVPYGWIRTLDENGDPVWYFVDSSGLGREDERAMTLAQFAAHIVEGRGYGVIEAGEFQVVVGEYIKENV